MWAQQNVVTRCELVGVVASLLLFLLMIANSVLCQVGHDAQFVDPKQTLNSASTSRNLLDKLDGLSSSEGLTLFDRSTPIVLSLEEYLASSSTEPGGSSSPSVTSEPTSTPIHKTNHAIIQPKASINIEFAAPTKPHNKNSTPTTGGAKPIPQHYEVRSLLNVTHDYPLRHSQLIFGYIWPLMAFLTTSSNLMIVFILTQRDMRTATTVVLTAIAIADIIPILVPVPWMVYLFAMGNEKQVLFPPLACYLYQHSTRSVSELFYFLSTWLNLLLAVQDYLTAAWPKLAKKYCQIKVVIIEIIILTLLAFILNLPQALKIIFKPVKFHYNGQLTWGCSRRQAPWFKNLVGDYAALYDDIFTAIVVLFVDGGPAVGLIVLTALLIRQLRKQRIQGHMLMEQARTASKRRRERYRQQEHEASARVMIFVLLAFLAVKIPYGTTMTLMIVQSSFKINFVENFHDFQIALTITDIAFVLSYPLNFTILCCCSKKFRHKCVQLVAKWTGKHIKPRLLHSFTESMASDTTTGFQGRKSLASETFQEAPKVEALKSSTSRARHQYPSGHGSVLSLPVVTRADCNRPYGFPTCVDAALQRERHSDPGGFQFDSSDEQKLEAIANQGKLCLECIVLYEQMKRSPSLSSKGSWSMAAPLPPPLPQLNLSQIPEIITTRCESALDQSSDEMDMEKGSSAQASFDMSKAPESSESQTKLSLDRDSNATSGESDSKEEPKSSHLKGALSTKHNLRRPKSSSPVGGYRYLSDPGPQEGWPSVLDRRSSGDDEYQRLEEKRHRSGEVRACPSIFRSDSSSSNSEVDNKYRLHPRKLTTKRLSLSLSNSKLSTLPNATGMLADVLLSTLLGENNHAARSGASQKRSGS